MHRRVFALDGTLDNLGDLVSLPISLPMAGLLVAAVGVQVAGMMMAVVPIVGGVMTWRRAAPRGVAPNPEPRCEPGTA